MEYLECIISLRLRCIRGIVLTGPIEEEEEEEEEKEKEKKRGKKKNIVPVLHIR
jgi:hypothetical protein